MKNDFFEQAYHILFQKIPVIFPEHKFVWRSNVREWWSSTYLDGTPHKRKDKTIISEKAKGVILEHGSPAVNLFNYIKDSRNLSDKETITLLENETGLKYESQNNQFHKKTPNKEASSKRVIPSHYKTERQENNVVFIKPYYMEATMQRDYSKCNFFQYLKTLFDDKVVQEKIEQYNLGVSKNGNVIFWQIDAQNQIYAGKEVGYNKDGRRTRYISFLNKRIGLDTNQCLFGLHLLTKEKTSSIAIVESEKTAIIASVHYPEFIWMATGGSNNLSADKLKPLEGKHIVLFPDVGKTKEWKGKVNQIQNENPFINLNINESLEIKGYNENTDLADILEKHPKYERPLINDKEYLEMEQRNPALKLLVEKFDLELNR